MNERDRRAAQAVRDDQATLRADRLRDTTVSSRWAGLDDPATAHLAAELLDGFADRVGDADPPVRRVVVLAARGMIGAPMDRPSVRRTRRR